MLKSPASRVFWSQNLRKFTPYLGIKETSPVLHHRMATTQIHRADICSFGVFSPLAFAALRNHSTKSIFLFT